MSLTFPVAVPSISAISSITFSMFDAVGAPESPYNLSIETQEWPGKRWGADVQLVPMFRDRGGAEWAAFLASLRGRRGTFLMGDVRHPNPRGAATGTPLVKGANQSGDTILIDGCGANVVAWIRKDDWIQFGTGSQAHLHKSLSDANSNGAGEVTLNLWPGPRTALSDNQAVIVRNTQGVWRLADNLRTVDLQAGGVFSISFRAMEAL
jgi:hypothetical protein